MKKRLISILLAMAMIFSLPTTAMAAKPVIQEVEYDGGGYVDVDFTTKVQYSNPKVIVKDSSGAKHTATITELDDDDLTFYVKDYKPGAKYTFTIKGVRAGKSGSYQNVSGSFRVPKWDPLIKEIEYDVKDKELEIEFVQKVQYKNVKVTIKNSGGTVLTTRIDSKNSREIEVDIPKGLKSGKSYTVTISGIRAYGTGTYRTISGTIKIS